MSKFLRLFLRVRCVSAVSALSVLAMLLSACGEKGAPSVGTDGGREVTSAGDPVELEFWQSVKNTGDADQLLAYIKKYPNGQFIELAESRLKSLNLGLPAEDPNPAGSRASNVAPPATPTAANQPPPAKTPAKTPKTLGQRDRVLSVVNRSLKGYRDPRLHIYPNVPRTKADNAAVIHDIDPRSILVLYDDGLRAGGKTGFVITDKEVLWRFVKGSDRFYIAFREIESAIARKNKFLLNGHDVGTTMSSNSRSAAQTYADLMISLRDAFR